MRFVQSYKFIFAYRIKRPAGTNSYGRLTGRLKSVFTKTQKTSATDQRDSALSHSFHTAKIKKTTGAAHADFFSTWATTAKFK
jgi:hypothetical protein